MVTMAMAAILKMHYYTSQGIIPLKFHYYQITNIFRTFMVTMGTVAILKEMFFLIPVKFHYNQTKANISLEEYKST